MKFLIFLLLINIKIFISQLCDEIKSCYNCSISNNNCSWSNNICSSSNSDLFQNNTNNISQYMFYPFIVNQYKCITNKNDIETFKELNNSTITLSITSNTLQKLGINDNIGYHIYCLEYSLVTNICLSIKYNKKFEKDIVQLSLYDNLTNYDSIINLNINNKEIFIKSNYFCIKITYIINNKLDDIISFHITKYNEISNKNKNDNIISYIILASIILLITAIIWIFIVCHKNRSGIMKEITILNKANLSEEKNNNTNESQKNNENCDKSNCSELQEKYFQLEQNSFVEHNYETLYSFVHNIHDIEKKDIYLKTIIKTMPSFLIGINNRVLIGTFCSFCENKIKLNDNVCLLNCGHIFHYDCIYQQIITNEEYKCIICKENIII